MHPNILLITSDQQQACAMGIENPEVQTPNLDRLARSGMICRRAYCPDPTCTPTRASILTGQYPSRHGAWGLGTKLPEETRTLGDELQQEGYDCSLIGKAHFQPLEETPEYASLESHPRLRDLDFWRSFHGPFYGFNHVELARNHTDEAHAGQHYALWMQDEKGATDWEKHFQNTQGRHVYGTPRREPQQYTWDLPEELHYNTWITERSMARIDEMAEQKKPFFLWASYFDPHPTYLVPEPWASMYDPEALSLPEGRPGEHDANPPHFAETQKPDADFSEFMDEPFGIHGCSSHVQEESERRKNLAVYYGMISMLDHAIGKLLDHLDAKGLSDQTLVVFTSDHGHYMGEHGLTQKGPFFYEEGIRVPFLARWPGHISEGSESQGLLSLIDLPASFLDAAGRARPGCMQGVSQLPVWRKDAVTVRDDVLVEFRQQPNYLHMKALVTDRYKLTVYRDQDYGELFDLQEDPEEFQNRWQDPDFSELKQQLIERMLHTMMRAEPMWMPRVAIA